MEKWGGRGVAHGCLIWGWGVTLKWGSASMSDSFFAGCWCCFGGAVRHAKSDRIMEFGVYDERIWGKSLGCSDVLLVLWRRWKMSWLEFVIAACRFLWIIQLIERLQWQESTCQELFYTISALCLYQNRAQNEGRPCKGVAQRGQTLILQNPSLLVVHISFLRENFCKNRPSKIALIYRCLRLAFPSKIK